LLKNGKVFRKTPGNGSMNDAWLGQTVKAPKTGQTSHDIPSPWMRTLLSLTRVPGGCVRVGDFEVFGFGRHRW
jgi:hypothetical protein